MHLGPASRARPGGVRDPRAELRDGLGRRVVHLERRRDGASHVVARRAGGHRRDGDVDERDAGASGGHGGRGSDRLERPSEDVDAAYD